MVNKLEGSIRHYLNNENILKRYVRPEEVAEKLNISVNTVKTLKSRAYKTLRANFGEIFILLLSPFL